MRFPRSMLKLFVAALVVFAPTAAHATSHPGGLRRTGRRRSQDATLAIPRPPSTESTSPGVYEASSASHVTAPATSAPRGRPGRRRGQRRLRRRHAWRAVPRRWR